VIEVNSKLACVVGEEERTDVGDGGEVKEVSGTLAST
jgi:hypothetical protein